MSRARWMLPALLAAAAAASGQVVPVPNASFEEGAGAPAGWTLSGGEGRWLDSGAADGRRALAVTGTGQDSGFWRSGPLAMEPGGLYVLRFQARGLGAAGGTAITGPGFCNRDLGAVPAEWTEYESVFAAPADLRPADAYLRLGQWNVRGTVAYDAVHVARAAPVYARLGDLALGEGERLDGREYVFEAPLGGPSANHSRPLASYTCGFNSNRWTFGRDKEVVYRHAVAGRRQTGGQVRVSVTYHVAGELAVEASADGRAWQPLGVLAKVSAGEFAVPAGLLPAEAVWVRLRARAAAATDAAAGAVTLQVGAYGYTAALAGEPAALVGRTRFLAIEAVDPRLDVVVEDLGEGVPGGRNALRLRVANKTPAPVAAPPLVSVAGPVGPEVVHMVPDTIMAVEGEGAAKVLPVEPGRFPPGESVREVPYALQGCGTHRLVVRLGSDFRAATRLDVADLYESSYGERLPPSDDAVGLWWCSSGWKVSRTRPVPEAKGEAVVVRAAQGEAEAAQVVVRPAAALRGLAARAEALAGPGGAVLPAENIDILRVGYVEVTQPTDATGVAAPWPDPLPPLRAPLDLEAGRNQPLWLRVTVPREAPAGTYRGRVRLSAEGWAADVPLAVEVYGFRLPDRMTCQSAFGFSPENVWRYQKVEKPEDRRAVLEKYLANFAAHRIAPYDPAPLDRVRVTWPKGEGGKPTLVPQFDWAAWDAAMARAMDHYRFNSFMVHVPGMGGGSFHRRVDPSLLGFAEDTPEYRAAFTNYARALEAHLREKGWLDLAYVYWFDEPDPKDYAFVMNGFRRLKEACPGITRMLTEQPEPALAGGPNLWCPVSFHYDHARAEDRRREGERFWWYVCCGPKAPYATLFIDHPATELRVWLWQTWQRRIDGILVWQTNYWTSPTAYPDPARPQNPYADPMGWVSGYGTEKGVRQPWGNGDGRFLYPPEAAADASPPAPVLDGPVDSIRWEMLRDGIEDYEYLAILRRLLEAKGDRLPAGERAKLAALLEVPEDITKDMTTFTKHPAPIERRRDAVARAIEALSRP